MTMPRNRDLFELWSVQLRSNVAETHTMLVWAHRMSDALRAAEEFIAAKPRRAAWKVLGIDRVSTPDTDTEDYASVAWVGGDLPVWPE